MITEEKKGREEEPKSQLSYTTARANRDWSTEVRTLRYARPVSCIDARQMVQSIMIQRQRTIMTIHIVPDPVGATGIQVFRRSWDLE